MFGSVRSLALCSTLFSALLCHAVPTDAAGISYAGGVVDVVGTNAADNARVNYISAIDGPLSRSPTGFIRVSLLNLGLSEDYAIGDVTLVTFQGLARDDYFRNDTSVPSVAEGGPGNDFLIGGYNSDDFIGGTGDDRLVGRLGNDILAGGDDADVIVGGQGFDFMTGGDGNDILHGGSEDDSCFGGDGDDVIRCGPGDDIADGGTGEDVIDGESGRDIVIGGLGRDEIDGGSGEDILVGAHVTFPLVHDSLNLIWLEWTSNHVSGRRIRNVLGFPHSEFDQRLNADAFLLCGLTVGHDGALDTIVSLDGTRDLCLIDLFDAVASDPNDVEFCD